MSTEGKLEVCNPANGSVVGVVPDMSADQVNRLAAELRAAQPAWDALGPEGRARHLRNWLDWIVDHQDHILGLVHREAGKSWGDAQIELMVCMEVINYYAKHGAQFLADETRRPHGPAVHDQEPAYPLPSLRTRRRDHPWNCPLAMPMLDIPPALMAGAAVLTKPSEVTPLAWAGVRPGLERGDRRDRRSSAVHRDGAHRRRRSSIWSTWCNSPARPGPAARSRLRCAEKADPVQPRTRRQGCDDRARGRRLDRAGRWRDLGRTV